MFTYNLLDLKRTRREGTEALAPGRHTIEYDFKYDGSAKRRSLTTVRAVSAAAARGR